jgi:uncharacterized membrane protein (GlpM family)
MQMTYFVLKAALSGLIVAVVSEVARRNTHIGGLIASLPLISILAVLWLWQDTADSERVAVQLESTLWYILPSLPFFLAMPMLLRHGVGFWASLGASSLLTVALYALAASLMTQQ